MNAATDRRRRKRLDQTTESDLIAVTPGALAALMLGADEREVLAAIQAAMSLPAQ